MLVPFLFYALIVPEVGSLSVIFPSHPGVLIGMSGFTVLESESRGDKLWVPTGTRAQDDYVSAVCLPLSCPVRCGVVLPYCGVCCCGIYVSVD